MLSSPGGEDCNRYHSVPTSELPPHTTALGVQKKRAHGDEFFIATVSGTLHIAVLVYV